MSKPTLIIADELKTAHASKKIPTERDLSSCRLSPAGGSLFLPGRRPSRCAAVALCLHAGSKALPELVPEADGAAVLDEKVPERLVREFLEVAHGVSGKQFERRPRFFIELHALARHEPPLLGMRSLL